MSSTSSKAGAATPPRGRFKCKCTALSEITAERKLEQNFNNISIEYARALYPNRSRNTQMVSFSLNCECPSLWRVGEENENGGQKTASKISNDLPNSCARFANLEENGR